MLCALWQSNISFGRAISALAEQYQLWQSNISFGRAISALAEQYQLKPGVLGSIPGGCQPFHFLNFLIFLLAVGTNWGTPIFISILLTCSVTLSMIEIMCAHKHVGALGNRKRDKDVNIPRGWGGGGGGGAIGCNYQA